MLFSEETDRKCFSEKWCDKSEVSLRETLMCSGLALHNRCPHRGIKKFASEKHASLSQYEMLLDNHVQGSGLAPPGKQVGFASEQHHCAAPRTNVPRAWTKNTALNEKRTVMQQSEQPCDRVKARTNLPSTACSSKCLASQEIVPLTTNVHPQKHHRGVRGPPTPIVTVLVMFFCSGRIAHPFGHRREPIPLRWHQTFQSGTKRTERTNGAHDVSKMSASKTQSTKQSLPIKSAPPLAIIQLKTTPSD